jgi:hypothetical protein
MSNSRTPTGFALTGESIRRLSTFDAETTTVSSTRAILSVIGGTTAFAAPTAMLSTAPGAKPESVTVIW